ncbi:MAG: Inner membrane protein involved in colicin E2 resistance [Parcubacteria group bacterium GW2011_GWE2_38_18]|nr:MAG: Inner membrane protein involved in colicin E2 resistance [Parcubacteria group bacterium GW2011_GWE2_38_18]
MFEKHKNFIIFKVLTIGFLTLLLLIPTAMISELIDEREQRRDEATSEIDAKWGSKQTIAGPILTLPYKKIVDKDGKAIEQLEYAHFLPDSLSISGTIAPEMRQRGIYQAAVYNSNLKFQGAFSQPNLKDLNISPDMVLWNDALVSVGIPDMRGIKENIKIRWNGKEMNAKPGLGSEMVLGGFDSSVFEKGMIEKSRTSAGGLNSGVNVKVALDPANTKPIQYSFDLNLNGSEGLDFVPLGGETTLELTSSWKDPNFGGAFLPDEREVGKDGFLAKWKVLQLNRNFPQSWIGNSNQGMLASAFGVNLLIPVDEYQKNSRSIKYAILFIALTFLIFFFSEVMNKNRIHPMQYLLVGLSLVLFFSLLLSLSEHLNFNFAYLISSLATILMVTLYSRHIFKSSRMSLLQAGIMIIVYGFIYAILQLQDYSLLVGSIGLFIILAIVMFISRKINWYEIGER